MAGFVVVSLALVPLEASHGVEDLVHVGEEVLSQFGYEHNGVSESLAPAVDGVEVGGKLARAGTGGSCDVEDPVEELGESLVQLEESSGVKQSES